MSATKQQTVFEKLREEIPAEYLRQRQQGGNTLSYISWYDACELLDERAPGWSMEVREIGEIAKKIYVRVALTIEGVTRENVGCEDEELKGYGDVFSNATGMALRRAAALFGLGRHLYDKKGKSGSRTTGSQQRSYSSNPQINSEASPDAAPLPNQIAEIKQLRIKLRDNSSLDFSKLTYQSAENLLAQLRAK